MASLAGAFVVVGLTVTLSSVALAQQPAQVGDWLVNESVDPQSGSSRVIASMLSEDRRSGVGLRCIAGRGTLVVNEPAARHIVGGTNILTLSSDNGVINQIYGTIAEIGPALADALMDGGGFGLRVRDDAGRTSVYQFRGAGSRRALQPLMRACGWR